MVINKKSKIKGMGSFFIQFKGGSSIEKEGERGLSHLAEHLLCKGWDHLLSEFTRRGIVENAYTSHKEVVFHWEGLDDEIQTLLERGEGTKVIGYVPTQEQFENEKKIVLQEYDDSFSEINCLFENINRKYFNNYMPIGFRKDIEDCSYEKMIDFLKTNFSKPHNIIRIYSGKNKFKYDVSFTKHKPQNLVSYYVNNDESILEYNVKTDNIEVFDWIKTDVDMRLLSFISRMWSNGLESPLYSEIREKRGLVYGLSMGAFKQNETTNMVYFNCSTKNIDDVRKVFKETITDINFLSKDRFEDIKQNLLVQNKKSDFMNYNSFGYLVYKDSYITVDFLNSLVYEDVMETAKEISRLFNEEIHYCSAGETLNI